MSAAWPLLSGSGLQRAEADPWAYALDADVQLEAAEFDDAKRGTAIHAFLEKLALGVSRDQALRECPREVIDTCAGINPAAVPVGDPEIAFVYDVATGRARRIPRVTHRDYGTLAEAEIPLTLDLIAAPAQNSGIALVLDWKTGFDAVIPAAGNLQLGLGAVCLAEVYGYDAVETQIARIDQEGGIHFDPYVLDAFGLEAMRARIARVHAKVRAARAARLAGEAPVVRPGRHCKYCPSKGHCPEYGREAMALATRADGWLAGVQAEVVSDEGAAFWWERLKKAREIIGAIEEVLAKRVERGEIRLSDGSRVRRVPEARRKIDGKRALPVLREKFGSEVAEAAADVKVTLTSIRAAFGADADGVLELLEAEGLLTSPTVMTTRTLKG